MRIDLHANMQRIEDGLSRHDVSLSALLRAAGVAATNWARWRKGYSSPTVSTWNRVIDAYEWLTDEAA